MKKQGYLLLVLLMSAFVFCSCGQKDTKEAQDQTEETTKDTNCLLYTSPSPRDS